MRNDNWVIENFVLTLQNETTTRKDAGVVERGGLENRCAFLGTQGSNPCLSAKGAHRAPFFMLYPPLRISDGFDVLYIGCKKIPISVKFFSTFVRRYKLFYNYSKILFESGIIGKFAYKVILVTCILYGIG